MGPDATTRGEGSVTSYDVRPIGRGRRTTLARSTYDVSRGGVRTVAGGERRAAGARYGRVEGAACDALWGNGVGVGRRNVGRTWMGRGGGREMAWGNVGFGELGEMG